RGRAPQPERAPARAARGAARLPHAGEPEGAGGRVAALEGEAGPPLIRLSIRAPAEHAEEVLAELVELAPAGFEQVDGDHFVEFALYGAPGELPELPRGRASIGGVTVEVSGSEIGDDWASRWRDFHRPVQVGRIHVRSPWHEEATGGAEEPIDIVIDPGQAFGTGAHPTTRLCLECLQDVAPGPLADLGCGSGVLAIAAANGVALERVERRDLRTGPAPAADVTVANLVRPLLLEMAALMPEQPGTLIVSGLLEGEEDEVAAAF